MLSNLAQNIKHANSEVEQEKSSKIDASSLRAFTSPSGSRRSSLISNRDSKDYSKTPRKHSVSAYGDDEEDVDNLSPTRPPRLEIPSSPGEPSLCSTSGSGSSSKSHYSEYPLVRRLILNQLKNNDYFYLEKLLLWNGESDMKDKDEQSSLDLLRKVRGMLMKDVVRSRMTRMRGDEALDEGFRVSMGKDSLPNEAKPQMEVSQLQIFRANVWEFMENPNSSKSAYAVSISILLLILLSSVTFCLETTTSLDYMQDIFHVIEVVAVICFTVEFLVRILSTPDLVPFLRAPLNIIDLVAILPFYIELLGKGVGLGSTQVLRVIRLVRVFRVLKLGGKSGRLEVIVTAVSASTDMLIMLTFLLLLSMIVFSSLIYFAEKNTYNESSDQYSFKSIPDSFWWCMVTLMTVGYGDAVPETPIGRFIATGTMISSIIILALPISVIGTNFTSQWIIFKEQFKTRDRAHIMRQRFSRSRRLIKAYQMSIDDLVKELGRASRRMEEKYNTVQETLKKASRLFKIADAQGSYPGTPSSAGTPKSPSSVAVPVYGIDKAKIKMLKESVQEISAEEINNKKKNELQEAERESNDGDTSADKNQSDIHVTEEEKAPNSSDTEITDTIPKESECEKEIADEIDSSDIEIKTKPIPPPLNISDQVSRQSSFGDTCQVDDLVAAHEELLSSIKDLEEAMSVYDELVSIAELLTAQKCTNTLDFCIQKHKRISKTMTEVEMVESAIDDIFDEYDYFLDQLNSIPS